MLVASGLAKIIGAEKVVRTIWDLEDFGDNTWGRKLKFEKAADVVFLVSKYVKCTSADIILSEPLATSILQHLI